MTRTSELAREPATLGALSLAERLARASRLADFRITGDRRLAVIVAGPLGGALMAITVEASRGAVYTLRHFTAHAQPGPAESYRSEPAVVEALRALGTAGRPLDP